MILLCILAALISATPSADLHDAILTITGASSVEELDEQVVERFAALHDHPIDINACGRSRLLASGLFTEYQVVSLLDYRGRNGDILSWSELGLVDGFSPALVEALKQFCNISLPAGYSPSKLPLRSIPPSDSIGGPLPFMWPRAATVLRESILPATHVALMARSAVKITDNGDASICYGAKCNAELGDVLEANWGSRTTYSDGHFGPGTASIAAYGRRGKIVVGDFNARYGQGLFQWSGFTMSSYSSVTAMQRKATGLSASKSFTRTLHGIGGDIDLGRWNLGGAWGWPGTGIVHGSRYGRKMTAGATAMYSIEDGLSMSADWRAGTGNLCCFGEAGWSKKEGLAATTGLMYSPSYGKRAALLGKWQNGRIQTVAGFQNKYVTTTIDAIWNNSYKGLLIAKANFSPGDFILTPSARIQYRYKPDDAVPSRLELRAEGSAEWRERWLLTGRYDWVHSKDNAWLWYVEGGHKSEALSAFLRFSLFKIDNWSDRIWVYERDAPGSFNVPAYYGRGLAASAVISYKRRKQCLHLRASTVSYPWNLQYKSPKTEIKLQYQLKL